MTKAVAHIGLFVASIAVQLGNYWFTFGLWPQSWTAFAGFASLAVVLLLARLAIDKESK